MANADQITIIIIIILLGITGFIPIWGPKKLIWVSVLTSLIFGIFIGVMANGFPRGMLLGVFIGFIFAVFVIPGCLITRYFREKAQERRNDKYQ